MFYAFKVFATPLISHLRHVCSSYMSITVLDLWMHRCCTKMKLVNMIILTYYVNEC
jgi:hypothetical protein